MYRPWWKIFGSKCLDPDRDTFPLLHEYGHIVDHNSGWRTFSYATLGISFADFLNLKASLAYSKVNRPMVAIGVGRVASASVVLGTLMSLGYSKEVGADKFAFDRIRKHPNKSGLSSLYYWESRFNWLHEELKDDLSYRFLDVHPRSDLRSIQCRQVAEEVAASLGISEARREEIRRKSWKAHCDNC